MENEKYKILFVDDEPELLQLFKDWVTGQGTYDVLLANDPNQAIAIVEQHANNLVLIVSDLRMPEMDGLDLRAAILERHKNIPFAILSGFLSQEIALRGIELKICAFIEKPPEQQSFLEQIEKQASDRAEELTDERELLAGFLAEAANLMEELEPLILSLEDEPESIDVLNKIFGILHTIKGTSSFFKPGTVSKFAHKFEDFLSRLKSRELMVTQETISIQLKAFDTLSILLDGLAGQHHELAPLDQLIKVFEYQPKEQSKKRTDQKTLDSQSTRKASAAKDWVRTPLSLLNRFMRLSGEITVIRNMVIKMVQSIERRYAGDAEVKALVELLDEMHQINSNMQNEVMELRKVSLKEVYRPISRTVRDLSNSLNKEVDLVTTGDDLRIDTTIAEVLNASVIHMIRNCLDHGLEPPAEREKLGKPRHGAIRLSCLEENDEVRFEISDDGRGIDPEKLKSKLLEKELYQQSELDKMSKERILSTIFESGFSTSAEVTDVSGRGVGMDQVKTSVEKLDGHIKVDSEVGTGSTITLHLPVPKSVQIITSLNVQVAAGNFSIPREYVERIIQLSPEKQEVLVNDLQGKLVLRSEDGALIPLIELNRVLSQRSAAGSAKLKRKMVSQDFDLSIVVIKTKKSIYGLIVDKILDAEDSVVKELFDSLKADNTFMAATFQGDGSPGLILDVDGIGDKFDFNNLALEAGKGSSNSFAGRRSLGTFKDASEFLLFELNGKKRYAVPLCFVFRLENIKRSQVQKSGNLNAIRYRDTIMPILSLQEVLGSGRIGDKTSPPNKLASESSDDSFLAIIIKAADRLFCFEVENIRDVKLIDQLIDGSVKDRPGILGNFIVDDAVTVVIDTWEIIETEAERFNLEATPQSGAAKRGHMGTILYAEDIGFYRNYITKGLNRAGYNIEPVQDGLEAFSKLSQADNHSYSLLLTDLNMPEMGGFELAEKIRGNSKMKDLPIIALTAHVDGPEREMGKVLGFRGYVEKLNVENVVAQLDHVFGITV